MNLNKKQAQMAAAVEAHMRAEGVIVPFVDGTQCGDGRGCLGENPYIDAGKISRFGADGGYALGLERLNQEMGLGFSATEAAKIIIDASIEISGEVNTHTDEHAMYETENSEDDKRKLATIGCGHLAKAKSFAEKYGLNTERVAEIISTFNKFQKEHGDKAHQAILKGEHEEKVIIFNFGLKNTVKHSSQDFSAFVVDTAKDSEYVTEKLFPVLVKKIPMLGGTPKKHLARYLEILNEQTATTAQILAPGFMIFGINADKPEQKPEFLEQVPATS